MTTETRDTAHDALNDALNAYLDGQLDAAQRTAIERHVSECALCEADLRELRMTRAALQALPLMRAPRTFVMPAEAPAPSRWLGLFTWGSRLGALATAACLALAVLSGRGGPATHTSSTAAGTTAFAPKAGAPAPAAERSADAARDQTASAAQRAAPPAPNAPAAAGAAGG